MMRRVLVLFAALLMPLPAVAGVVVAGPPPPYVIAFNGQSGDVSVNSFTNAFCYTCTMPGITMTSPATLDGSNVATSATVTSALSPYLTSSTAASTYSTPASLATAIAAITPYTAGSGIAINAGTRVVTSTVSPSLTGATASVGGGLLAAATCTSGTATVSGATTSMVAVASPVTYPGDGVQWQAYVSSVNTVTVKVCSLALLTPTSSVYNVRVVQ